MSKRSTKEQLMDLEFEIETQKFFLDFPNFLTMEDMLLPLMKYWFEKGFLISDKHQLLKEKANLLMNKKGI